MKSGENGLIGAGDNNYGSSVQPYGRKTISPEILDKILKEFKKSQYDKKVSMESNIHHLSQCKARIGKLAKNAPTQFYRQVVLDAMAIIDYRINKIKNQ